MRLILFFTFLSIGINAQLPTTQMHLFKLVSEGNGVQVDEAFYLNSFNKNGYNNQPHFLQGPNRLLIASNAYHPDSANDILLLDLNDNSLERLTPTIESEYSPTPFSRNYFSCVRVEKDGKDQGLWSYSIDKSEEAIRLIPNLDNIGYHLWLDSEKLVLFLVDKINYMALAYPEDGSFKVLESNIGRCFKKLNDSKFLFVHKVKESVWYLKSYDIDTAKTVTIAQMPEGVEDFELLQDNTIICGNKGQILIFDKDKNNENWLPYLDLSPFGLKKISRLIMKKNILVTVSE